MAKYAKINLDIYKRYLLIFIGTHREFKVWVDEYYKYDKIYDNLTNVILDSDDNAQASFWYNPMTGDNIIELKKFPRTSEEIACAAHEVLHAVIKLLDFVGVEFKQGGANEAYTYLLEYILIHLLNKNNYYDAQL